MTDLLQGGDGGGGGGHRLDHSAYAVQSGAAAARGGGGGGGGGGGHKQSPPAQLKLPSPPAPRDGGDACTDRALPRVWRIDELLPPHPARIMRLFGVRDIGGGYGRGGGGGGGSSDKDNNSNRNADLRYQVIGTSFFLIFSLQWATVLVGLGHGLTVSLLSGVFMLLTIVLSSGPETRIFRSDYVARQLADSAEDRAALRAWCANATPMVVQLAMWVPQFMLVCWPVLQHADTGADMHNLMWAALVSVPVVYLALLCPAMAWSPLTEIHAKRTMIELEGVCARMLTILRDQQLSPREAAHRLGVLHRHRVVGLHRELKTWGSQAASMQFMAVHGVVQCLFAVFAPVDETGIRADPAVAMGVRIWFAVCSVIVSCPWSFFFVRGAAKPSTRWRQFERSVLMDASVLQPALAKFSGSAGALNEWLRANRTVLHLFGLPIDDALAGKLAAVGGSVVSVAALVIARFAGWY